MTEDGFGTDRLVMTPLAVADAEVMVEVLGDPELYRFTGGEPPTLDRLRERYRRQVVGRSPDGTELWFNWVVRTRAGRRPDGGPAEQAVGYVQATLTDGGSVGELAWVIGVPWQGQGYASEAAAALAARLSDRGVAELRAHIHPRHLASEAVAGRLGLAPTEVEVDGERRWRSVSSPGSAASG